MPDLESEGSPERKGQGLKMLTPNHMFSRLTISLAKLKAGNNSEKLKNEIRQLLNLLHWSKKLSKTIYYNLINSISKMETIFMNTENSKTNEPHKFRLTLADKLNLKDPDKNMALANLSIFTHGQTLNLHIKTITLKFLLQLGMMNLIYLMDHILFQTFKIILNTSLKNMRL